MNKFLIGLLVVLSAYADIGPVNQSVKVDSTGTIVGPLDQYFIKVKNQDGSTMAAGEFVFLDTSNDDGFSVVTSATSDGKKPHCMIVESCAAAAVCTCQTYGYTSIALYDNNNQATATAGEFAYLSQVTPGYVVAIAKTGGGAGATGLLVFTDQPAGEFLDSPTSTGAVELFLRMR